MKQENPTFSIGHEILHPARTLFADLRYPAEMPLALRYPTALLMRPEHDLRDRAINFSTRCRSRVYRTWFTRSRSLCSKIHMRSTSLRDGEKRVS